MEANHLTALTSLIDSSIQEIISTYASVGQIVPTLDSVEPVLFDSLTINDVPERLTRAIQLVEAACTRLIYSVARPGTVLLSKAKSHMEIACLNTVIYARIPDLLVDRPEGMHVSQLSELSEFTAGLDKLERVMRFLASKHIFRQVKPGVYSHNRLSMKLLSKESISDAITVAEDCLPASAQFRKMLTTPEGYTETAFHRATGCDLFEYYGLPENKEKEERFQRSMLAWDEIYGIGYLGKVYPWAAQPTGTTLCDVGGGNGHVTMGIIKSHPHLKLVIQDRPAVVQIAREFWATDYPEALEEGRVDFIPLDFFKDTPVEGCDVYHLKNILHDWSDVECIAILKNVRKAMKPSSRVIIQEIVIPKALNMDDPGVTPESHLPSWGPSEVNMYEYDILMMECLDAKERTLEEFVRLGSQSDLNFEKVYPAGDMGVIVFSPV
ncbi:hypothetical protein VNI00_017457 [Paramarasmius palmivorus]|uniref:S-adenosyl-L-methionine-dependent methyltransferase n=1 Tax=Paramarasmius palmivorus TaxID=297713 RepID=A0AAW0B614_9AGAR